MNCDCQEKYDKILNIIRAKKNDFKTAFEDGPTMVRGVKFKIIEEIHELLKGYTMCGCFLGQNLSKIQSLLSTFFDSKDVFQRDLNHTAFENEKDKLYDKIGLILNTK